MRGVAISMMTLLLGAIVLGGVACADVWHFGDASLFQDDDAGASDAAAEAFTPDGTANVDASSGTDVSTCTPTCSGKVCGASDGCDGTCAEGSCTQGQRCMGGACICDATSCSGCCKGGVCETDPLVCGTAFVKYGNNGTLSCDAYCAGALTGPSGTCVGAQAVNVPCAQRVGFLSNGAEILCLCHDASANNYEKHGNNGTASCETYCAGTQGGPAGSCGQGVITHVPCSQPIGQLANGSDLQCTCQGATSCSATLCTSPANGFRSCKGGACSFDCNDGYAICETGCCKSPPAFLKYGNNGTQSCDGYCAGAQWGPTGTCVGGQALDVPCSQATGYFTNQSGLMCTCTNNGQIFDKFGNDGSASCNTYCAGAQWGPTGTCVHAAALNVPCSQAITTAPLTNTTVLQCTCQ